MKKILFFLVSFIALFILFPSVADAACYRATQQCNNGPSRTDSGGCGTACGSMCDDTTFTYDAEGADDCRVTAASTVAWKKYEGRRYACSGYCDFGNPTGTCYTYSFTFVILDEVCSTADKHYPNRSSNKSNLYAGYCDCGSVSDNPYKACCVVNSDETRSPVDAITFDYMNDGYEPPEGNCPSGSQVVVGSFCPQPPTVSVASACTSTGVPVVRWSSNGDRCTSNNLSTGDAANNTIGVPATVGRTYTITCYNDYYYYRPDYSGGRRTDSASASASVTVAACTNCPSPAICYSRYTPSQTTCAGFNKSGLTLTDGTQYSSVYLSRGSGSDPCGAGNTNICCLVTYECGRCSTNPGQETNWIDWTDANADGTICNDYNNNRRTSANDSRCTATRYYACNASNSCAQVSASDATRCAAGQNTAAGRSCFTTANCNNTCAASSFSVSLTASPNPINSGGSSTLSWTSVGAVSCSLNQGIGSVLTSSSRSVSPSSTTTYTITCTNSSGLTTASSATVTVNATAGCYSGPRAVSADISATRDCLPEQPGQIVDTRLNWSGSVSNVCGSVIGGGSPSNYSISCSNSSSNWSGSGSGSSSVSGNYNLNGVSQTQDYSLSCSRSDYTCSSSQTFSSHDNQNDERCTSSCTSLKSSYPAISSCSCSQGSCVERWSDEAHCTQHACGSTHEVCDSRCVGWSDPDPITGGRTCEGGYEDYNCRDVCNYDGPCIAWSCRYYAENQSVSSSNVCGSSDSDSQQVRFIKKPGIPNNDLTTNPFKAQILLNQLINLVWNVSTPNSGVPTTLRCTPTVRSGGDGEGWIGAQDSLQSNGTKSGASPNNTTTYRLDCRNRDNIKPNTCYNDSDRKEFEVKVFEPTIEEKSPTLREIFGKVFGGLISDKFKNF